MKITFFKGLHHSIYSPFFLLKHIPFLDFKSSKWKISFEKNCLYHFNNSDDHDINKLIGISKGFHHKNSFRIGWRPVLNKIELFTYIYKNGIRIKDESIFKISPDDIVTINFSDTGFFLKICVQYGTQIKFFNYPIEDLPKWGYYLFPYFGGNLTAPHKMHLVVNKNI